MRRLHPLSDEVCRSLFILNACLEMKGKRKGPTFHQILDQWLNSGLTTEKDLAAWIEENYPKISLHSRQFDRARRRADAFRAQGIWAAGLNQNPPSSGIGFACPRLLFGKGTLTADQLWAGIFNSRKSKLIQPDEDWVVALRSLLSSTRSLGMGLASSLGTKTYDLVTVYAQHSRSPLFLVLPFAIEDPGASRESVRLPDPSSPYLAISCLTRVANCSRADRMVCRDRILAFLTDLHWVLEIRSEGNLWKILEQQQSLRPRMQWVMKPERRGSWTEGNFLLMEKFPRWSMGFSLNHLSDPRDIPPTETSSGISVGPPVQDGSGHEVRHLPGPSGIKAREKISWKSYLFHYTRPCPGPWPNQDYQDYLLSLLQNDPLAGHTALDTLIHILRDTHLRGSSKLVRGSDAVISFSSTPPHELNTIRQWNPALIRWTFEPYGLAIDRKLLKTLGARPAIYAKSDIYDRLRDSDRFRFQRNDPLHCSWKHEREWRLPGDLSLGEIPQKDFFVFVPSLEEARQLTLNVASHPPIVIVPFVQPVA